MVEDFLECKFYNTNGGIYPKCMVYFFFTTYTNYFYKHYPEGKMHVDTHI